MSTNQDQNRISQEDSIDVIALLTTLWQSRKFIVKTILVFLILGVLISLLSPVKYSASTVFVPQLGSEVKAPSGLSSLASLAGINLSSGNQGGDISPLLYPNLSSNIPFKLALLSAPITEDTSDTLDVQFYLLSQKSGINILSTIKKYTIGLPGLLFSSDTNTSSSQSSLISLTEEEEELVEMLSEKYTVSVNEKEGYVAVSALDKNPVIAAELVRIITANLQDEIIQKRLEKVQNNLDFTQNQYNQKKLEFEKIQDRLARFKDRNQNISSSLFLNELERIQAEYSIALKVVTELATQVESAKLRVNKDTPIFSVIDPVTVPTQKEYPKRKNIVVLFLFFGFVIASTYILVKQPLKSLWDQIVTN
tara:strand:- start:66 stop:1160 length:1095 start_codon:yes stop_codon:yes gene_type:complete